ncbi:MAG: protein kinase [Thermoanaerobaculia bacterium]
MIGTRLGSYEITAKLGEGGMGEVYRATDGKLGRDVAIKVLPAGVAEDPERLARFDREARALAQLHHPHVASIFGVEESGGVRALVMELVEGPTLAERIAGGPVPVEEALAIARQIAEALEAAHEKGIVHRDLKPQNIKAPVDGPVKVLDFGLAKALDPVGAASGDPSASRLAASPTLTLGATVQGVLLGTAAYMAPEQAKGATVDKRADIWAFGVVLWEMLTGRRLFEGDSAADTLAGVLRAEIDLAALPGETPPPVRRLLHRCLERQPRNRLHDIADARIVLDEVIAGDDEPSWSGMPATATPGATAPRRWLAGGALVGLLTGAALVWGWGALSTVAPPASRVTRFEIPAPEDRGFVRGLALSPDGSKVAFVARDSNGRASLWLRELDALAPRELPGTADARYPFWAPDGRRIGFFSGRSLWWTDTAGGAPLAITSTAAPENVRGASWGADDVIVFAPTYMGPLQRVHVSGGEVEPATRLQEGGAFGTHRFPSFLPDGVHFVFFAALGSGTEPGELFLGRLGSLEAKRLGPSHSLAVFAEPGYLLYTRGESLVAHRLDLERQELVGEPTQLGVSLAGSLGSSGLRELAASATGGFIYRLGSRGSTQLVWVDRAGADLEALTGADEAWHYAPRLSPDGRSLAVGRYEAQTGGLGEIWVHDLVRKLTDRVTFDDRDDFQAIWAGSDGRELVYASVQGAGLELYRTDLDRPAEARPWPTLEAVQCADVATPEGRRVVFETDDGRGGTSLWIKDLDGDGEAVPLGSGAASELAADISPDGQWLAYASDATRSSEVYVRRLDGTATAVRVSADGGGQPLWRRDGRELFYLDPIGRIVAVPIASSGGEDLELGRPEVLFFANLQENSARQYDAAADGRRFLLNRAGLTDDAPIVVVLDWPALLPREAP